MNTRTDPLQTTVRNAARATLAALLLNAPAGLAAIGDFNGDGIGDLAIGVPQESLLTGTVTRANAGAVIVIYGTANNGLRGAQAGIPTSQQWHQDVAGIADTVETNDRFGEAVAAGDFNGDGFADLAIAVLGDNAVQILNGSASGLTVTGSRLILASQIDDANGQPLRIGGTTETLGPRAAFAVGDFNGDQIDDLAIEGNEPVPELGVSKVAVMYGSLQFGLQTVGVDLFQFANNQLAGPDGDIFGVKVALAAGDVDNDGNDDLAVGLPFTNLSGLTLDAGRVHVLLGSSATGLSVSGIRTLLQSTGNGEPAAISDHFGAALAMGDFNGDGRADLAVGTPNERRGVVSQEGSVSVFSSALTFHSLWTESVLGQPRDSGDRMGTALAAADFNGDGRDDLAIGTPGDFVNATTGDNTGSVTVIHGGVAGLAAANAPGVAFLAQSNTSGVSQANEKFGSALSAGNVGRSAHADLVVGSPFEDVSAVVQASCGPNAPFDCIVISELRVDAGQINAVYGGAAGLSATGAQAFTQNSTSIPDTVEAGDRFGAAL